MVKMKTTIKLEIPKNQRGVSGSAVIRAAAGADYHAVIAYTKHPEEKPVRTEIFSEFTGRSILFVYFKTSLLLTKAVNSASAQQIDRVSGNQGESHEPFTH